MGENGTVATVFLFDFYAHYTTNYPAPFGHNTQRRRQKTDRAIGIGQLCSSTVSLIFIILPYATQYSDQDAEIAIWHAGSILGASHGESNRNW